MKPELAFTLVFLVVVLCAAALGYATDGSIRTAAQYWMFAAIMLGFACHCIGRQVRKRWFIRYDQIEDALVRILEVFGFWALLQEVSLILATAPFVYLGALVIAQSEALSVTAFICVLPLCTCVICKELAEFRKRIVESVFPFGERPDFSRRSNG